MGWRWMQRKGRVVPIWICWKAGTSSCKQDGWSVLKSSAWGWLLRRRGFLYVCFFCADKEVGHGFVLTIREKECITLTCFQCDNRYQNFLLYSYWFIPVCSFFFFQGLDNVLLCSFFHICCYIMSKGKPINRYSAFFSCYSLRQFQLIPIISWEVKASLSCPSLRSKW